MTPDSSATTRMPILADDMWYPRDKAKLEAAIDGYLEQAKVPDDVGDVVGIIAAHAGYRYSGLATAHSYKAIGSAEYDVAVVMAPTHSSHFTGASILNVDNYSTPLGSVQLDREVCDDLLAERPFTCVPDAHAREHSLEIQLPFLQRVLGDFLLVPIVFGQVSNEEMQMAAAALRKGLAGRRVLYVASTDFTHYGMRFNYVPFTFDMKAKLAELDGGAVDRITAKDFEGFIDYKHRTSATICGWRPVATLIALAEENWQAKQLTYYTSGDLTNDWSNCVSYVSLVFVIGDDSAPAEECTDGAAVGAEALETDDALSAEEQGVLLKLARDTVETYVRDGRRLEVDEEKYPLTANLKETSGVFVTLKKQGRLRGCIGHIMGRVPLYQGVVENGVNAASRDHRFPPVRPDELKDIDVEVSVLTPFREVPSAEDFVPGKHGIYITKGRYSAVFLPQVASEQGWDRAETFRHLCAKAGLPMDEWKRPGMKFQVCTGQAFGEKEH